MEGLLLTMMEDAEFCTRQAVGLQRDVFRDAFE